VFRLEPNPETAAPKPENQKLPPLSHCEVTRARLNLLWLNDLGTALEAPSVSRRGDSCTAGTWGVRVQESGRFSPRFPLVRLFPHGVQWRPATLIEIIRKNPTAEKVTTTTQ
jgi:hypothetical protein